MLAYRIALRYIFSKKSTQSINIITGVSMLGMAVGAFALITVLSVFNGFEGLVLSLYNSFYPDIEITASEGKTFVDSNELRNKILKLSDVSGLSATLEENAYLEYGDESLLGTVKGVDSSYGRVTDVAKYVREGSFQLRDSAFSYAVLGANISFPMNISVGRSVEPLRITVPRKGVRNALIPEDAFNTVSVLPGGVFSIQQEFDSKYVFVSLAKARELAGVGDEVSAYELKLKDVTNLESAKVELSKILGKDFTIKTRYEQKAETYRVMLIERWVTTAILGFIILIISFNIIGSLTMLVIDKKKDISILKAMGADSSLIIRVYLLNGILASAMGAVIGLLAGYAILLLQIKFHFLRLGNGPDSSFVINYYPVKLKLIDPLIAVFIIIGVSLLASYFPAKRAGQSAMTFK